MRRGGKKVRGNRATSEMAWKVQNFRSGGGGEVRVRGGKTISVSHDH